MKDARMNGWGLGLLGFVLTCLIAGAAWGAPTALEDMPSTAESVEAREAYFTLHEIRPSGTGQCVYQGNTKPYSSMLPLMSRYSQARKQWGGVVGFTALEMGLVVSGIAVAFLLPRVGVPIGATVAIVVACFTGGAFALVGMTVQRRKAAEAYNAGLRGELGLSALEPTAALPVHPTTTLLRF